MKAVKSIFLLVMLLGSHAAFAAMPVFGTTAESKYARELVPPKGKAIIYVYQRNEDGEGLSPTIWLNNYEIGRIIPGSFTVWQLAPGKLELRVGGVDPVSFSLTSQAGKIYLFRLSVMQTGEGPKAQLTSLPEFYRSDLALTRIIKNPRQVDTLVAQAPAEPVKAAPAPTTSPAPAIKPVIQTSPAASPRPTRNAMLEPGGFSLILKTGSLSLAKDTQTVLGTDLSFNKSASSPFAIEAYYQFESGLTVGGEYLSYKAEFTPTGSVDAHALLANVKQYFYTDSSLQPYIGAGIGVATADISGAIVGTTAGVAYQLLAGAEYRFDSIGVIGEARYLSAKTKDSSSQTVDVSGTAIFAGIVFHF